MIGWLGGKEEVVAIASGWIYSGVVRALHLAAYKNSCRGPVTLGRRLVVALFAAASLKTSTSKHPYSHHIEYYDSSITPIIILAASNVYVALSPKFEDENPPIFMPDLSSSPDLGLGILHKIKRNQLGFCHY